MKRRKTLSLYKKRQQGGNTNANLLKMIGTDVLLGQGASSLMGGIGQGATGTAGIPIEGITMGIQGLNSIVNSFTGNNAIQDDITQNNAFKSGGINLQEGLVFGLAKNLLAKELNKSTNVDNTGTNYYKGLLAQQERVMPHLVAQKGLYNRFLDNNFRKSFSGNANSFDYLTYKYMLNPNSLTPQERAIIEQQALQDFNDTQAIQNRNRFYDSQGNPILSREKTQQVNNNKAINNNIGGKGDFYRFQLEDTETSTDNTGNNIIGDGKGGSKGNTEAQTKANTLKDVKGTATTSMNSTAKLDKGKELSEDTDTDTDVNKNYRHAKNYLLANTVWNALQGIQSAIGANNAFRKLKALRDAKLNIANNVRGAELQDTTNAEQKIRNTAEANANTLSKNTGNLQALMAGITNLNKQVQDNIGGLRDSALQRYKQEEDAMYSKSAEIAQQQNIADYKYKQDEINRLREAYKTAIQLSNASLQAAGQNMLGIAKNFYDIQSQRKEEEDKIKNAIALAKNEVIEELKRDKKYYYELDEYGNPKKDAQGNFIRTTPEKRKKLEQETLAEYRKSSPQYARLLELLREYDSGNRRFFKKKENSEEKAQRGKKVIELDELDNILSRYVKLTHNKNTRNRRDEQLSSKQIYDASKNMVNNFNKIFSKVFSSKG